MTFETVFRQLAKRDGLSLGNQKPREVALSHPTMAAETLGKLWTASARAWERDDHEAELALAAEAESFLVPLGVEIDYPGLYPCFKFRGAHYIFADLPRVCHNVLATHRVTLDGAEQFRSTENECFAWLLKHQSSSVSHALAHEGYAIEPLPVAGCDGSTCGQSGHVQPGRGELRRLPTGGDGVVILCRRCFDAELDWRRERNRELEAENTGTAFDIPEWEDCEVYQTT